MRKVRIEFFSGSLEDVRYCINKYEDTMDSYLIVDDNFKKFNPLNSPDKDMGYRLIMFVKVGVVRLIELSKEIDKDFIAIIDADTEELLYSY